jgi:hypothetical protein
MARWGVLGGAAALLVLATACDIPERGQAVADPAALRAIANAPVSARTAFGPDLSTVDPCSIVDVDKLSGDLDASLEPADGFDDCPVSVTQSDGTKVDVSVGPLETRADRPTADLVPVDSLSKGMRLYTDGPETPGFCDDFVTFADDLRLLVSAEPSDVESDANVCPAAEALARNAADEIRAGSVKHTRWGPGSLGSVDPCTIVPDSAVTAAGLTGVAKAPYPERHECAWIPPNTDTSATVRVLFDIGTQPKVTDKTTDTQSDIAGRPSVTSKFQLSSSGTLCYIETAGQPSGSGGDVEIAIVDVHTGPAAHLDACGTGTKLATTAWPALPNA